MPQPAEVTRCPNCRLALEFLGTKKLHEGTRAWDFFGGIWELLKNREKYDVYVCPRCGRLEFFLDGVGDALRGEGP
jgi:hypothetical protein